MRKQDDRQHGLADVWPVAALVRPGAPPAGLSQFARSDGTLGGIDPAAGLGGRNVTGGRCGFEFTHRLMDVGQIDHGRLFRHCFPLPSLVTVANGVRPQTRGVKMRAAAMHLMA